MSSLQSWLAEAKDVNGKKKQQKYSVNEKSKNREASMSSSMFLLADFGVPFLQRLAIESSEGLKTLKGVGKDLITREAWTNPKKNKQWTEDLGRGYSEARNRVQQSLRKANDTNIEKELMKNKALDLQIDKMRQTAKKKYAAGEFRDLAPLTRQDNEGLLALDKRYKVGKEAKK